MNALTKVFIVLLVVFSIAFTMMTIQFATNVPDWKNQATDWKTKSEAVDAENRNLASAKIATEAKAAADRQSFQDELSVLTGNLDDVRRQVEEAQARNTQLETDLALKETTYQVLAAQLSIAQETAAQARSQRGDLEQQNIELGTRAKDLSEALNERIATIMVLEQQTRQQEQAVALLRDERDNLMRKLNLRASGIDDSTVTLRTDRVRAVSAPRTAPIRGRIDEVGRNFASISVGSNDGVEVGMVFIIYNGGGYLGDLSITEVNPDSAAGRLKKVSGAITVGDQVADENGYLAMN